MHPKAPGVRAPLARMPVEPGVQGGAMGTGRRSSLASQRPLSQSRPTVVVAANYPSTRRKMSRIVARRRSHRYSQLQYAAARKGWNGRRNQWPSGFANHGPMTSTSPPASSAAYCRAQKRTALGDQTKERATRCPRLITRPCSPIPPRPPSPRQPSGPRPVRQTTAMPKSVKVKKRGR